MLRKNQFLLLLSVFLVVIFLYFIKSSYSSQYQMSYILDPDNPVFNFSVNELNNTRTNDEISFSGVGNQTAWIRIPKNSTILYSNMTLVGHLREVSSSAIDLAKAMAIGDVNSANPFDEIAVGTTGGNVMLLTSNGSQIWSYPIGDEVYAVGIGNLSSDQGQEIAAGGGTGYLYLLNSIGQEKWNLNLVSSINNIAVGKINATVDYDQIAVAAGNNLEVLDYQHQALWSFSSPASINAVGIGNLSEDPGNEVVAGGDNNTVYVLNSSGQQKFNVSLGSGTSIKSISVGIINKSLQYDQIVIGENNRTVFAMDNLGYILWSYSIPSGNVTYKTAIGNLTTEYPGNDVAITGDDKKVHFLNSSGNEIFTYYSSSNVRSVAIGNLTSDPQDEIAAYTQATLYILNLEYFPTNVTVDIGADGNNDWASVPGKLRTNVSISNNSAFQSYLSACTQDQDGNCDVPLVIHSDYGGNLNITLINVTYQYNASGVITYQTVNAWSRTREVSVNESIGNQTKNITYGRPPVNITINYIKVADSATRCDFNGTSYPVSTVDGKKVCGTPAISRAVQTSGSSVYDTLWDDSMGRSVPIFINESAQVIGQGSWRKNITIWNATPTTFYNISANSTINESVVKSQPRLKVDWYKWGNFSSDITPSVSSNDCNTSSPTYTPVAVGADIFYVCMQDTNNDSVNDLFAWKQPNSSTITYELSGSSNLPPQLTLSNVSPNEAIWGSDFNISVNVSSLDMDNVTVKLWANISMLNSWQLISSANVTGNQTITFNFTTNKSWTGSSMVKFEYADFNFSQGIQYHDWANTTSFLAPNVTKRNVSVTHIQGGGTSVNRTGSDLLIIQVNDTNDNTAVSGASCTFWVSTNDTNWDWGTSSYSNQTGYCNITFSPNGSYIPGLSLWKAGTYQDSYYQNNISSYFNVTIYGKMNINIVTIQNFTRGSSNISATVIDEFGYNIPNERYNCSWYINNMFKETTQNSTSGNCNYTWTTNCSDPLDYYLINVTLVGNVDPFYLPNIINSTLNATLQDRLTPSIILPIPNSNYHAGDLIYLNSTFAEGSCGLPSRPYSALWIGNSSTDGGPICNMQKSSDNTTYTVETQCAPAMFVIKLNATGEFYSSNQKNVTVNLMGWSIANMTNPQNGTVNRTQFSRTVTLVCYVKDANLDAPIENYPVKFWDKYYSNEFQLGSITQTNHTGYATYLWNISDHTTVPEGAHTIKCNITDTNVSIYRSYNASVGESSKDIIIQEYDANAPTIEGLYANSVTSGVNVTIEANVTDWYGVKNVSVNVTFPDFNSTSHIYYLGNTTPNIFRTAWRINLTNLNIKGDYDFRLSANDTSNNINTTTSWFEIYEPIHMYATTNYQIDYTFYRPGTNLIVHNFEDSSGSYDFTIHKRNYDFMARISDSYLQSHSVRFNDMNSTRTSESQFGIVSNITSPLNLSVIPLSLVEPPIPWRHELSAIQVTQNISFSNVTVTLNYSNMIGSIDYEPAIKIYRCSSWNSTCVSGWTELSGLVNTTDHTISTTSNSTSVFYSFEAEVCGNAICGSGESCVTCPSDCGQCSSGNPGNSGSSGSSGISGYSAAPSIPQTDETKFSIRTNLTNAQLETNETEMFALWISNEGKAKLNFSVLIEGSLRDILRLEKSSLSVDPGNESMVSIYAYTSPEVSPGSYSGDISVTGGGKTQTLPITLTVSLKNLAELDATVESLTKQVNKGDMGRFRVMLYNLGVKKNFDANITYSIKMAGGGPVIYSKGEIRPMDSSYESYVEEIPVPSNATIGSYLFLVEIAYEGKNKASSDLFEIKQPFWTPERILITVIFLALVASVSTGWYGSYRYAKWKASRSRYIFPVSLNKLPKGDLWLGKVAESGAKATFDMSDLSTHILVAGATGSGKSVSGSIIAEELLEKKIPIVVFDPTAQWTGFVRPCTDANVLRYYKNFGMSENDAKPFKGMIYEVTNPKIEIDFKKYMNPGEITVFTLNKLEPGEYDEAVINIINTIFRQNWEESTKVKLIVIFDEVHRLLEKYGGKGGYVALERACREFRKWGIGMIMVSQVLSDFKEAIKGNVLTEIQLHTKSLEDLSRVEKKYGLKYTKGVAREEIGVGMIQNPKYNDGIPWFISFRPPMHMPHKIVEADMKSYREFSKAIEQIEVVLDKMEKSGENIFDMKTELKLAKDKLKEGRFRMAEIYITSLKKKIPGISESK